MPSRCLRSLLLSALCLLVLPAGASAVTYPTITKVSPAKLAIGDTMTITGKNFRKGTSRNTVVFKRDGGRAIFVKVPNATSTRLSIVVPAKLLPFLVTKTGKPTYRRFRIRVLSGRFGKRFTAVEASPLIGSDCDQGAVPDARDTDDDNDLIADATEATLKTSACKRDTDGDGMSDGWEYHSALDRNSRALPYPGRKPYPNALFADGGVDHDGDGLTNADEYAAWAAFGADSVPLSYSGGNPTSAGRGGVPPEQSYLDRDGNGLLSDNERDADGDAIANQDEGVHGLPIILNVVGFFSEAYLKLPAVTDISQYVPLYGPLGHVGKVVDPLEWLVTDTDGDGVPDGADDVDHDDVPNLDELLAELAMRDGLQRPLNACVPNADSRFCIRGA